MKKILVLFIILISSNVFAHMDHYKKYNKIQMDIFRNGELIGYNYYFFTRKGDETIITNEIKFSVKLLGATVFQVEGSGEEKYIKDFFFINNGDFQTIRIFLKYDFNGVSVIENIKRCSRPGQRIYVSSQDIPRVLDGLGISILSTSKGVISNKTAKKLKVGGELLCEVF